MTVRTELEDLLCYYREGGMNTETAADKIEDLLSKTLFGVTASQRRILEKLEAHGSTLQILNGQICGISFKE